MNAAQITECREVLTAVLEALDIPHAAMFGGIDRRRQVLEDRAMHTVVCLRSVLAAPDKYTDPEQVIRWTVEHLREQLAENPPIGYRHWAVSS